MISDTEYRAVVEFLHREARLADEARYAEWLELWTDDGVYWVPATTDPGANPERHLSHIYDNRARIETRVKLLQTGVRRRGAGRGLELHPGRARGAGGPRAALVGGSRDPSPAPRGRRSPDEPQDGRARERGRAAPNLAFLI